MVPSGSASRQVLIWSVPTLVILLSLVWYRRKRNTLRTDPGGTSDSASKARASAKADKQTNGYVHPGDDALAEDLLQPAVQPAVPNKEPVKSVVQQAVPEKKSVVQEAVPEKRSVVKEAVPDKESVVKEAVPEKKSVVQEAVPEKKSVVQEAVPEKKSVVEEAVPEKKSVVQEAVPEKKSVVQEALPQEVKKEEPSVVQAVPEVEEQVKKAVVKEEKKPSVVQEEKTVKKAVPKEVEEQMVAKKVAKAEKKPSVAQGEKKVAKKAVPKEVEEQVVVKKVAKEEKVQKAASKVEEAVVVKKEGSSQESVPAEKPRKKEMSEEEVVSEGAAAVDAAAAAAPAGLQEEKVGSLGGKLASLTLEEQRADADRDSANHSPVDAMLASPSLSNYSDEHSEGSSDSGKGCSDVASPPSRTPLGGSSLAGDAENDADVRDADVRYTVYEFLLPHYLVGRLIGPRGSFVQEIKSKTNATVQVKKHPELNKQKICVVDGTQSEVDAALAMIRERYPVRKFPVVTLEQVSIYSNAQPQPTCALIPEYCQLHLVEGVNNEVMVSCMVSPGHMFLQQPYHPTFQYLTRLSEAMNSVYSHADAPHVPEPITVGSICVAPATEGWYRVQVVSIDDESHSCEVKFVDHGGYMTISNSSLRQIHHDFMSVPFQATECFLANIKPPGGSNVWSDEAVRLVDELTRGQMLYAQVYDYTEYSIPLVYLYCCINSLVVLINQELVARGLAELDDVASMEPVSAEAAALVAAAAEVAPLTRQATETPSEVEAV